MPLNERIKACRQSAGMSQEKVAELVGVSRQAVTKWESGQSAPTTENLFKLAHIFGTTVDLLLGSDKVINPSAAEHIYSLYRLEEERKRSERRSKIRKNILSALSAAAGYIMVYLAGRFIWCDLSESSFTGWLLWAGPSGDGSYLYGWLLSSKLFWWAMAVSTAFALAGKYILSLTTLLYFVIGLAAGIIFGPNPEGAAYGHSDYGWAIWGGIFLVSLPIGIIFESAKKRGVTAKSKAGIILACGAAASIVAVTAMALASVH